MPYILLFMVFQITPLQVYRTNVTFPRSGRANGKDSKQLPRKLKSKQNKEPMNKQVCKLNHKEDILSNLKMFKSFYLEKISDLENNNILLLNIATSFRVM